MQVDWNGVYSAVTTKFHPNGDFDFAAFDRGIEKQLTAGVHGIVIAGSLGEVSTMNQIEKEKLIAHSVKMINKRVPLVFNLGEQSTEEAVYAARKAEELGADGIMLLPPMRYRADDRETVAFMKAVAQSVSLPVIIYNNPVDYRIFVTLEMFAELAECVNIVGVKESTRDVINVSRMKNRFGDRFKILTGVDPIALESLMMGASGWIAGLVNAFPEETVAVYNLAKAGRYEEAAAIQRWFMPLLELDIHPKLVQYIKLAESMVDMGTEHVRAPRLPLEGDERQMVINTVNQRLACRPCLSK